MSTPTDSKKKKKKSKKRSPDEAQLPSKRTKTTEEKKKKKKKSKKSSKEPSAVEIKIVNKPDKKKKKKSKKSATKITSTGEDAPQRENFYYVESKDQKNYSDADIAAWREKNKIIEIVGRNMKPIQEFSLLSTKHKGLFKYLGQFERPTPIQAQTWPLVLSGLDVIGVAQTGSGKTLSFLLPGVIHTLSTSKRGKPTALVIAPTRELALQTQKVADDLGKFVTCKSVCLFGGTSKYDQIQKIRAGITMVCATPGRLLDLVENGPLDLSEVSLVILDEADRMLDMGFIPDVRRIISHTAPTHQTLMYSATWPDSVRQLATEFLKDPTRITVGSAELNANKNITQIVEVVDDPYSKERRLDGLLRKYHKSRKNRILIFALYKKEAARLEMGLKRKGWSAVAIHGDMGQDARIRALDLFTSGKVPLLVATDVAARGLDIPDVEYVINVTFPLTIEDYVHRIGRTARAGKKGIAHTFFTSHEKNKAGELVNVLREAGQEVPEALTAFGVFVKRKEHAMYGAHFRTTSSDKPMPKASHVTFDSSDESD